MAVASPQATKRPSVESWGQCWATSSLGAPTIIRGASPGTSKKRSPFCPPAHPWFAATMTSPSAGDPVTGSATTGVVVGTTVTGVVAATEPTGGGAVGKTPSVWTLSGSRMAPKATNPSDSMTTAAAATSIHDRRERRSPAVNARAITASASDSTPTAAARSFSMTVSRRSRSFRVRAWCHDSCSLNVASARLSHGPTDPCGQPKASAVSATLHPA